MRTIYYAYWFMANPENVMYFQFKNPHAKLKCGYYHLYDFCGSYLSMFSIKLQILVQRFCKSRRNLESNVTNIGVSCTSFIFKRCTRKK